MSLCVDNLNVNGIYWALHDNVDKLRSLANNPNPPTDQSKINMVNRINSDLHELQVKVSRSSLPMFYREAIAPITEVSASVTGNNVPLINKLINVSEFLKSLEPSAILPRVPVTSPSVPRSAMVPGPAAPAGSSIPVARVITVPGGPSVAEVPAVSIDAYKALEERVKSLEETAQSTRKAFSDLMEGFFSIKREFENTKKELVVTRTEFGRFRESSQAELASIQAELAAVKEHSQAQLTSAKIFHLDELAKLKTHQRIELESMQEKLDEYIRESKLRPLTTPAIPDLKETPKVAGAAAPAAPAVPVS